MDGKLQVKYKIWLDSEGKAFGEGPRELLLLVEETGSLRQAAQQMQMSYSMAHKLINQMEDRLGIPLIERTIGGPGGGGSRLTDQAHKLLAAYDAFMDETRIAIDDLFRQHFPD